MKAVQEQLDKEKKELLEATNMEAAEKDRISKELGIYLYYFIQFYHSFLLRVYQQLYCCNVTGQS